MKGDAAENRILSLFNCAIPLCDADAFEETIASIAETEADVVCVHDIANEEVRYRIYEVLREQYGYFCLEIGDNGGALIASKYRLGNEKNAFFDDNGVFFEIRVFDGCKEIGRIVLARPNRALFSEQLASAVEQVTEMIQIGLLQLPEPILFCGNFPRSNPPSEAFGTLLTEYFENDGADNEAICSFLLSSSLFFQTITGIPLAMDSQGLLSVISICDVNLYLEAPNSGRYLLKYDVSGSAGYDCASSSSYADVSIGTAGDGWSASVHGDVHRDSSGQTSGGARVEFSGTW